MTIRFTCSECASVLKIKDELAGTTGRCPKCKTKFVVPDGKETKSGSASDTPSTDHQIETISGDSNELSAVQSTTTNSNAATTDRSDNESLAKAPSSSEMDEAPLSLPFETGNDSIPDFGDTAPLSGDSSDSATVFDKPLALGESDDVQNSDDQNTEELSFPLESSRQSLGFDDDDDLDSPPVLAGSQDLVAKDVPSPKSKTSANPKSIEPKSDHSLRAVEKSKPAKKKPSDGAFDPLKYLASESHSSNMKSPPLNMMDDSDLSLSDDSDYDLLGSPTPQPPHRAASKPVPAKPTPEKVDLASAAKMMKKAIKDAQADAARQRQIDAKPGFDYGLFFREFGLRGLAIVVGLTFLVLISWRISNYTFKSQLRTPPLGIVRGTIKMNGQPLSNATVYFAPLDTAMEGSKRERLRTSYGVSDDKGQFKMMYSPLDKIEGVAAGKCRVYVTHMGPKSDDTPSPWRESAMRIVDVPAGAQKAAFDIEMQSENQR